MGVEDTVPAEFFVLLTAPLKPGVLGRKRHELDSPNLEGHLPHPLLYPFLKAKRNGLWLARIIGPPYRAYLLSDLRALPPLKEANRLRPAFVAVKGKFLDLPRPPHSCER
ncbi:hypothetical protein AVEN_62652-1 [Araneus ventricosus]|uniref:Uncharacterized protein n=1 Tax=Araneus ventricosus TaxID=182803 RepID=A0A4Y2L480_ARAVE|nr:hypothetical protein AVEN_62652-1 [Araneus ventricosus]